MLSKYYYTIFYKNNAVTEDERTNERTHERTNERTNTGRVSGWPKRKKSHGVTRRPWQTGGGGSAVVSDTTSRRRQAESSRGMAGEIFETWKCLIDIGFKIGEHYLNTY